MELVLEQLQLDWGDLTPEVEEVLVRIATDGVQVAFDQIGVDPGPDMLQLANKRAIAWAQARAAELVGMQRQADGTLSENSNAAYAISDSTREMLRGDVATALDEGLSSDDLAAQLEDSYAFSADRAETIARTELANADVQGNLAAYRSSGVVKGKEWVLGSEHEDDDECDDAAAMGVVDLDDDFGGLGDPPAHPNCVCDVLPVLDDSSTEE